MSSRRAIVLKKTNLSRTKLLNTTLNHNIAKDTILIEPFRITVRNELNRVQSSDVFGGIVKALIFAQLPRAFTITVVMDSVVAPAKAKHAYASNEI